MRMSKYRTGPAEQGKFYRPMEELEIPVYLDQEVKDFFARRAVARKVKLERVINTILRKEMEDLKKI